MKTAIFRVLALMLFTVSIVANGETTVVANTAHDEPVLGGVSKRYSTEAGDLIALELSEGISQTLTVSVRDFSVVVESAPGESLSVGYFDTQESAENVVVSNGLSGCSQYKLAKFHILDIEVTGSAVTRLAMDVIQQCDDNRNNSFLRNDGIIEVFVRMDSDAESPDQDDDGIVDITDNCPAEYNALQSDADVDGIGDVCDGETLQTFFYFNPSGDIDFFDLDGGTQLQDGRDVTASSGFSQTEVNFQSDGDDFVSFSVGGAPISTTGLYDSSDDANDLDLQVGTCDWVGFFEVSELTISDDIDSLALNFSHECQARVGVLYGEVRVRSVVLGSTLVDADQDGFADELDNCPQVANNQTDSDGDGYGDACDRYAGNTENTTSCIAEVDAREEDTDIALTERSSFAQMLVTTEVERDAVEETNIEIRKQIDRVSDFDLDGVLDEADVCPDTTEGEFVDGDGCSMNQFCSEIAVRNLFGVRACEATVYAPTAARCSAAFDSAAGRFNCSGG